MVSKCAMEDAALIFVPSCKLTYSQKEKLQSSLFDRESEVFSADEASEQATGIIMTSMPESSDDYQTPPEHQLSSQNSSNDGQVLATKTAVLDQEAESGGVRGGEKMVVDDSYDRKEKRMVDLTKDSDDLAFLEKSPRSIEKNDTVMVDVNDTEEMGVEFTVEETKAESRVAPKVFVEMPMREQEARMSSTEVNRSLNKIADPKGKRQLPVSFHGAEKKHEGFIDTLSRAMKLQKGDVKADGDDDFLETAKRQGMTFPRPRWWPPEGEGGSED
ncbi:hypothetical protein L2E82_40849 [Cichorium intybus]|uniref:Uncharacterized protein n=1 Tax=Cichorium intybus TaxID=13427 RepID=A0ACB9AN31_CICIN|nr:hypothetical protein L2E82_40849 [Cichorium intybus]